MKILDGGCTFLRVGRTFLTNFAKTAVFMCVLPLTMAAVTEMSAMGVECPSEVAMLPDILTVIPQHIQLVNAHKREIIRFSNGIANLGDGPWRMRPEFPEDDSDPSQHQNAIQEILNTRDSSGCVVDEKVVSEFEFHPTHNHWHIEGVALYEIRKSYGYYEIGGADIGDVLSQAQSTKVTFCLIDWIKLGDNSSTTDRVYWDCAQGLQGISVDWVDVYHHELEGQDIDITGASAGKYYLVSTSNPFCDSIELSCDNNRAWVAFELLRNSKGKGNPKIKILGNSFDDVPLNEREGVPPDYTTNR